MLFRSFETRATEYSKGATKGSWQDVWSSFDSRRDARASEGAHEVAAMIAAAANEPDMFGSAGVAAE